MKLSCDFQASIRGEVLAFLNALCEKNFCLTSNRPLEDWGKLLGDVPATAILDRFLHRAVIIAVNDRSYRMKNKAESQDEHKNDKV